MVREACRDDLYELLKLYLHLHEECMPENTQNLNETWNTILQDKNHHVIVKSVEGKIVSSCVCVIIPNLSRGVRPYALIENVVTHSNYRGRGYASECLTYAREIAETSKCYKIMIFTRSKESSVLDFYRNAGSDCTGKTAFVRWI